MRIAVTGGLGFIGLKLAHRLIAQGHVPVLIDSVTPQIHGQLPNIDVPDGAVVVRMDVRELAQHPDPIDGCDAVFHLAAETGTGQSMYKIHQYVSVNDLGTAALFEALAACRHRPRRLVLASSRSVYGEGAYAHPANESEPVFPTSRTIENLRLARWDHFVGGEEQLRALATPETAPLQPGSVYAATKAAQELLVAAAAPAFGLKGVILRFQNVYGEGQSLRNPYTGIISIFYNRARQGMELPLYEDGFESRDFIHVDDVVEAMIRSLEADLPSGTVINVGSGEATSVRQLAETLLAVGGLSAPVRVTGQFRVGDIRHCYADITRLQRLLGFTPRIDLVKGLTQFVNWARMQPAHEDQSEQATQELRSKGLTNES